MLLEYLCLCDIVGADEHEVFTIRVHQGRKFTEGMVNYEGGEITYFDYISYDYFSLMELNEIAKRMRQSFPVWY